MTEITLGQKLLKNQVIRFVFSAGIGFLVDISAYYVLFKFFFTQKAYHFFSFTLSNIALSLAISFFLGVLVNFLITRFFVFTESTTSPTKQFIRFASVAILGFFANLIVQKFFIQVLHLYPPVARIAAALSLFFASYFVHKFFSFSLAPRDHVSGRHKKD